MPPTVYRATPGKGKDPNDPNIYCAFPPDATKPDIRCGRRANRNCTHHLCSKCCGLIQTYDFEFNCKIHSESATGAKAEAAEPRIILWKRFVAEVNDNRGQSSTPFKSPLQLVHVPDPSSPPPTPSITVSLPPIIPKREPNDSPSSSNSGSISNSNSKSNPSNQPDASATVDLDDLVTALAPLLINKLRPTTNQNTVSHSLPTTLVDANFGAPPSGLAGSTKELWTEKQACEIQSFAVYKMGDSATVQELKRELDLFIRMSQSIPPEDPHGVLADQQAKCCEIIYKRMGYKHAWAAAEKSFLQDFVDIPTHLGKLYAYLNPKKGQPPASFKGNPRPFSEPPRPPAPAHTPAKPPPSTSKPPSACRRCGAWHWMREPCPQAPRS